MIWRVAWAAQARRDLRNLDRTVAARVVNAVDHFAESQRGDVRHLKGTEREHRLRVGDWRVRFPSYGDEKRLEILRVLPRGRAYRD